VNKGVVYILKSQTNGRYYIGSTDDLDRRLKEHNSGNSKYTSESGPWEIVFCQTYKSLKMARTIEYWLKRQKSRVLIERIIVDKEIKKIVTS